MLVGDILDSDGGKKYESLNRCGLFGAVMGEKSSLGG
jgi:hypothetical protein